MAADLGVLNDDLQEKVKSSRILVVGAGGIGCELLKNLVLTGFKDIEVIDLDTIDVSNLNRQFLFRKEHVGKSKAQVARESALKFNPDGKIKAYHDSVMSTEYDTEFFKQFDVVLNALDNRAARNHVNRMCLAADKPLVESGTAGYLGQVTVIKKGLTECYECQPKPHQKTFPGCTIRNTPSEPIHCIVWAKHLFNQLFGEADPDEDVSPDTEDPELAGDAGKQALQSEAKEDTVGGIERKSTRIWAQETGYDPMKIFNKLFRDDIHYLLSMESLWKKRRPPEPLDFDSLPNTGGSSDNMNLIHDQRIWSVQECADIFKQSVDLLKSELQKQGDAGILVWDKDEPAAMDFVTAAANIRAYIFGIPIKSRFDIKSMAGNIIPAIATTNAIIAGLLVMEALKILSGNINDCRTVYLNRHPNSRKKLLVPCMLDPPNPKCYVCSSKPEVTVKVNTTSMTVKSLEDKVIKGQFGLVAPDVELDDGKGTIIISSEEGETEENAAKPLSFFGIKNGSRIKCDDFLQEYNLNITLLHVDKLEEEKEFEVVGDVSEVQARAAEASAAAAAAATTVSSFTPSNTAPDNSASNNGQGQTEIDDEDDLEIIEDEEEEMIVETSAISRKRKADEVEEPASKKARKLNSEQVNEDDDAIVVL
ncbi:SUMO-activating enzyme subunit 2 isoform X1 [Lingula anatina]|uniref:SUMO-activating enzyme subunit n=1 Tax=Lingula anatina TaxID=7574 RepID=A0A1S3J3I5_LINAN|nr:SUMO-activating enzyme subunit 2 isoform X1 [Lingula anatina]|eukprot:XP_013404818.1 SUMO-activating enzyme subunit 2 isoform X1 [Lingula anatina]